MNDRPRPRRSDPIQCPYCSSWVDPYHPNDARLGRHEVRNETELGQTQEVFRVMICGKAIADDET